MGLVEEIFAKIEVKGTPDLEKVLAGMKKLGYNLRLTGRDLMRMASGIRKFSSWMTSFGRKVFSSSEIIQDAFQDVWYSLEDAMEATGFLDIFVDLLEKIADYIDSHPWVGLAIGIMLIIGTIGLLISQFMMFIGFTTLLSGAILSAKEAHLSLWETLKLLFQVLTGNIEAVKQVTAKTVLAKMETQKYSQELLKLIDIEKKDEAQKRRIYALEKKLGIRKSLNAKATKKRLKQQGLLEKKQKSFLGTIAGGIKWIASLAIGFVFLSTILEAIGPILASLGDAVSDVIDQWEMEGIIDQIVRFIEANKELVVYTLLAVVLLPHVLGLFKKLGGVIGKITGKIRGVTKAAGDTADTTGEANKGWNKTLVLLLALIPEVVLLIYAMAEFVKQVAASGFELSQLGAIIGILVGAIGGIMGILLLTIKVLDGVKSISSSVIAAFITLAGVALALVIAFGEFLLMAKATGFDAAAIATILIALTGAVGGLMVVISGATYLLSKLNSVNLNAIGMIITLAGVIIGLILALGTFLDIASRTGFQVSEISTILDKLTGAIVVLVATLVAAVSIFSLLSFAAGAAMPVVAVLLGIGAAALLIGAGFYLAGLGIKAGCQGLALLVSYVPQLVALIPIIGTLILVFGGLGLALGAASLAFFAAFAGLAALAIGIFGVAAAVGALAVALNAIPDWAQGFVGGIGKAIGGIAGGLGKIIGLQAGGVVTAPGLAVLHPAETVLPAKAKPLGVGKYQPKEPPLSVSVDITGARSIEEIVQKAVIASSEQLSERMAKKYRRSEF